MAFLGLTSLSLLIVVIALLIPQTELEVESEHEKPLTETVVDEPTASNSSQSPQEESEVVETDSIVPSTPDPNPVQTPVKPQPKKTKPSPTGPSQAEIDSVRAERAYLQDQIQQSDAQISRLNSDLDTKKYQLRVAEKYNDTLRANQLRAEIQSIEADINSERRYGNKLRADLNKLPNW